MLQPREVALMLMYSPDSVVSDGRTTGALMAESAIKDTDQTLVAELNIETSPAGAWTGKLVTGETSGAVAAGMPQPKDEEAQALFKKWRDSARLDGKIPGGALGSLATAIANFVKFNPTDERAPQFAELLKRIDMSHDWAQADAVALLDDVTAIYPTLPKWAAKQTLLSAAEAIRTGQPLPVELENAPWGEAQPNGLRAAWLLDPRAEQHRLDTPLRSRILFHNAGKNTVVFLAMTWNQSSGHKAHDAEGEDIKISSTFWTTLPQVVACRLAPGEYTEVTGAGIGVGASKDDEDWRGTRVGAWIEAKEGDEVTFTPAPVSVRGQDDAARSSGEPHWWLDFITDRLRRDSPVPADASERERLLDRAMRDLFGTAPTPEETATFVADRAPDAMSALANRLAQRAGISPFTGALRSGETKFRVLAVDPDAAKKPRVATGPGRYTLGNRVRLVIVRKSIGKRRVNEANIVFFSPNAETEPPGKRREIKLPDGLSTWAIAWQRGSTVLWVARKGVLSSYDFTNPADVKETRIETADITNVPEQLREALRPALEGSGDASAQPAATPANTGAQAIPRQKHLFNDKYSAIGVMSGDTVNFLLIYTGFLSSGMQSWMQSRGADTKWGFEGAVHLVDVEKTRAGRKGNVDKRKIALKYTSDNPDTLFLDGKAYHLSRPLRASSKGALAMPGRIFILRDEGEPLQSHRTLPLRNKEDLVTIGDFAERDRFLMETSAGSTLATDPAVADVPVATARVTVFEDGAANLNGKRVTLAELKAEAAKQPEWRMVIHANKNVHYAKVMRVVEALQAAGVTHLSLGLARVGSGKFLVANRTGLYNPGGGRRLALCRPTGSPQHFTLNWPAMEGWPKSGLQIFPNTSEQNRDNWAVTWEPGADVLWWVDERDVGKVRLTNPSEVLVTREGRENNFSRDFGLPEEVKEEFRKLGFVIGRDKTPGKESLIGGNTGGQEMLSATTGQWIVTGAVTDADGKPLANVLAPRSSNLRRLGATSAR
ncbi:MAG: DUF1549 domain-containing protein [Planctomycetes bacterium]|nr:DUF1549 domain-containing protein [Planctomycetota bacterium]